MARVQSEGSVYQIKTGKHAGKYRGAVVVGWKPGGQPDRKTAMRDTENQCKAALRDLLNKRDAGQLRTRGEDWTLATWLPHWLDVVRLDDDLAASTRVDYESLTRIWLVPHIGTVRLSDVTEKHAVKVQAAMKAVGRSASRRHHVHVVLHAALDAAARQKLIGYNPIQHVKPPAVPHRRVKPPERADVERIYQSILGDRMEARWLVALIVGLRQGETLGLEWRHVDLDAMTVTIEQQQRRTRGRHACGDPIPGPTEDNPARMVYRCGFRYASKCPGGTPGTLAIMRVKTERGNRTVPLTPDSVTILRALKLQQSRERLMHGEAYRTWTTTETGAIEEIDRTKPRPRRARPELDLVFRHGDGRPIDSRQDWQAWYEVLTRAGLATEDEDGTFDGGTRLHNARHAAAVAMIDSGVTMSMIGDLMGHASSAFSVRIYGHLSDEGTAAARDLMQAHHAKLRAGKKPSRKRGTDQS